ncbi:hypothetical protein [Chelativorans sp. YIM 93263]|nr:hypothetical protein [Chelativorans sp. YIM 93263]
MRSCPSGHVRTPLTEALKKTIHVSTRPLAGEVLEFVEVARFSQSAFF